MARTRMIRANHSPPDAATAATASTKLNAPVKVGEYPGWNLDLRWVDQDDTKERKAIYPMGTHHNCHGNKSAMLLVREVAMMMVMDRLSDKPNWHVKVFDDTIAEKWRQEALAWPEDDLWERIANIDEGQCDLAGWWPKQPENILSKECVDYCILELRHKAKHFERTGITPTLDATFSIAKSDILVPADLHSDLQEAFAQLQADQASSPDWHPHTNETVQDLVHPSMYPLVYGRSLFLPEEVVGVEDAIDKWAGKGEVIPKKLWKADLAEETRFPVYSGNIGKLYWSTTYQWLPANIKFVDDGGVKFTSYINGLHPSKYRDIYMTIEKLIEKALPMWDQCLAQYVGIRHVGPGTHEPRITPEDPDDENEDNWDPKNIDEMLAREAAESGKEQADQVVRDEVNTVLEDELRERWYDVRKPLQPPVPPFDESHVSYALEEGQQPLREQFKETGLQIIVKMATIELSPEKPEFPAGGWHVEGQMNEHIVGTALYYLDSENITDSHLEFRTLTDYDQAMMMEVSQDGYHWMESVYGASLGDGSGSSCLQNYGSVKTPQGRLLAFPNVFQHRVSGFKLADPTKPGHRRFIALWLVDPFTRIISTANVPPQRAEWWAEKALGAIKSQGSSSTLPPELAQLLLERGLGTEQLASAVASGDAGKMKLPAELMDMVRRELGDALPMTRKEAEEHRLKLMKERSSFQKKARDGWRKMEYSFCEH